jgi:hypothetical protein
MRGGYSAEMTGLSGTFTTPEFRKELVRNTYKYNIDYTCKILVPMNSILHVDLQIDIFKCHTRWTAIIELTFNGNIF